MIIYDQKRVKSIQDEILIILKYIKYICEKEKITFWLAGGTMLGAVRHHGFIPWDDDGDVFMLRDDYEKFKNILKSYTTDFVNYGYFHTRVYKIKSHIKEDNINCEAVVDLFVLDRCFKGKAKRILHIITIKILQGMLKRKPSYSKYSPVEILISFILSLIGRLFSIEYLINIYEIISKLANKKDSSFYWMPQIFYSCLNKRYHKADFTQTINMPFCDTNMPIPVGYDNYLTTMYGDYMTLPPIEKQIPMHDPDM